MIVRRALIILAFVAAGAVHQATAQDSAKAGPSFLIFRYASRSSLAMYSGYTTGPVLLVVGMLNNPRTSYREIMVGAGRPFAAPNGNGVTVVPALAWTNSGWYGELNLVPSVRVHRLSISGTLQLEQPLGAGGTRAAYISPGNAFFDLGGGFSVGAAYYGSVEAGNAPGHGVGPAFQHRVPRGSVTVELVKGVTGASDEVRLTLRSSF